MATAARLRSTVLLPALETHETLRERSRLRSRLAALRAERDSLARELVGVRSRARQADGLRNLLELPDRASPGVAVAELEPGEVRVGGARSFLLRTGRGVAMRVPTGVFAERGLVGVVRSVGGGAAAGDFWTHPDFRVSVRTAGGEASGIVRPSFETEQPGMILDGAPYQQDIPEGTMLYTSGLGGIYPAGVPVGTVRSVSGVESGWEKSYRVEPAVRPGEVDAGLVWLGTAVADPPADDATGPEPGDTTAAGDDAPPVGLDPSPGGDDAPPAAPDTAADDGGDDGGTPRAGEPGTADGRERV